MTGTTVQDSLRVFTRMLTEKTAPLDLSSRDGFCRDLVLLNAGAGFIVSGKASGFEEGRTMAAELFDSGKVAESVRKYREAYDACK